MGGRVVWRRGLGYAAHVMAEPRSVIIVGNFEGLHLGHQALFARARRIADQRDAQVVARVFSRHPIAELRPHQAPAIVMHQQQKAEALQAVGVNRIDWLEPTPQLLNLTPRAFVEQTVTMHNAVAMVEGANFRFGHRRAGNTAELIALGEALDFEVVIVDLVPVALTDKLMARSSSTLVRWLISHGRVADAAVCLGRPWVMRGRVIAGDQRGRTLGSPTANLDTAAQMLPADAVYARNCDIDGACYLAAISVGTRPTFGGGDRTCEVFVLDYEGDLYGRTLDVRMLRWLREQRPFVDAHALGKQIAHDVATIRDLRRVGLLNPATGRTQATAGLEASACAGERSQAP